MSKTIILENEFVSMWHYPEHKLVHHQFHKFIWGDPFRDLLLKGLNIFKESSANKWLSDDRENSALPRADGEWAQTVWFPQVMKAGWKYWAIVMPKKAIGQMNMKSFMEENMKHGLIVQAFTTPEEALDWLIKQN